MDHWWSPGLGFSFGIPLPSVRSGGLTVVLCCEWDTILASARRSGVVCLFSLVRDKDVIINVFGMCNSLVHKIRQYEV